MEGSKPRKKGGGRGKIDTAEKAVLYVLSVPIAAEFGRCISDCPLYGFYQSFSGVERARNSLKNRHRSGLRPDHPIPPEVQAKFSKKVGHIFQKWGNDQLFIAGIQRACEALGILRNCTLGNCHSLSYTALLLQSPDAPVFPSPPYDQIRVYDPPSLGPVHSGASHLPPVLHDPRSTDMEPSVSESVLYPDTRTISAGMSRSAYYYDFTQYSIASGPPLLLTRHDDHLTDREIRFLGAQSDILQVAEPNPDIALAEPFAAQLDLTQSDESNSYAFEMAEALDHLPLIVPPPEFGDGSRPAISIDDPSNGLFGSS